MEKNRPKILIIYTGGTIGMIENPVTRTLLPFDFSHLMENVPKVKLLDYDIDNIQFNPPIDSSNMNPMHWRDIAQAIECNYDKYDGFGSLKSIQVMEKAELIEPFSDTYNEHAQIRKIPIEALKKHSNVEYAHIDGTTLHLQIITPQTRNTKESDETYPCIVYVQGSAWMKQNINAKLGLLARL